MMRLILVDWVRKARAQKRGGGVRATALEEAGIIELRCFVGMTVEEMARSLAIPTAIVEREMRFAQLALPRNEG